MVFEPDRYYHFYRGIIIQNNDPLKSGRVKVFIPSVNSAMLNEWNQKLTEDDIWNHNGQNVNGFSEEILNKLKKNLPWGEVAMPLFGMNSNGFFFSPKRISTTSNDSNLSGQTKANTDSNSCQEQTSNAARNFKSSGNTSGTVSSSLVGNKLLNVQATAYGYPSDPYLDSKSKLGIGNRDNQLSSGTSVALLESSAQKLGVSAGDKILVTFPDGRSQIVTYDDTIPPLYSQDRVDFYFKTDAEKSQFSQNGSRVTLEKLNSSNQVTTTPTSPSNSNVINPPNFVEANACNQGGGSSSIFGENNMDYRNYAGNNTIESSNKRNYPQSSYENPNNYRGANTQLADLALQIRPVSHSNSYKGAISIPGVGAHVWCFFENGDPLYPVVFAAHANQEAYLGVYGFNNFNKEQQYLG